MNSKTAIIMAPIMPEWDEGAFCVPLTDLLLTYGYRISIYDTMSIAYDCADLLEAASQWGTILRARHQRIDFAIGQAYGGALLQYLLANALADCPKVLGISVPTYCDNTLRAQLADILKKLTHIGPLAALQALDWSVQADHLPYLPPPSITAPPETKKRLQAGLSHLDTADARTQVKNFTGQTLCLYGENSRLVRSSNALHELNSPKYRAIALPSCGMRPLNDARELTLKLIEDFLKETP